MLDISDDPYEWAKKRQHLYMYTYGLGRFYNIIYRLHFKTFLTDKFIKFP